MPALVARETMSFVAWLFILVAFPATPDYHAVHWRLRDGNPSVITAHCRDRMNQQQRHWLEKLQVQVVVAGALAAVYFALWKLIDSGDPQAPLSLLAAGDGRAPIAFAMVFWVLAGLCAVVTVPVRPASAMLTALIGMGGLSLRSGPMRILVWNNMDRPAGLYHGLIVEIVLLSAVLLGGAVIVGLVRTAIRRIRPASTRPGPIS